MKPPTPMPMMRSASSTLTTAMIPSSRLVVSSSPDMVSCASEGRRLVGSRVTRRGVLADGVVQQPPAFVGDARRFLDGGAEAHELAREIFERRLQLPPHASTLLGEKQIACHSTDDCTHQGGRHHS